MSKDALKKYSKYYWMIALVGIILLVAYGPRITETNSFLSIINACSITGGQMKAVSATSFDCICPEGKMWSIQGCIEDPNYVAPGIIAGAIEGITSSSTLEILFWYVLPVLAAIGILIFAFILYNKRR